MCWTYWAHRIPLETRPSTSVDLLPRSYHRPSFSWKNFSAMSAQSFPGTKPFSHGDDWWRPSQNSSLIEIAHLTFNDATFNQQVIQCNVYYIPYLLSAGSPFCRRSVVMILSCYLSFVDSCARVPVDSSCARVPVCLEAREETYLVHTHVHVHVHTHMLYIYIYSYLFI